MLHFGARVWQIVECLGPSGKQGAQGKGEPKVGGDTETVPAALCTSQLHPGSPALNVLP